jgi:hypothetical protein
MNPLHTFARRCRWERVSGQYVFLPTDHYAAQAKLGCGALA